MFRNFLLMVLLLFADIASAQCRVVQGNEPQSAIGIKSVAAIRIKIDGEESPCSEQAIGEYLQGTADLMANASHGQFRLSPIDIYNVSITGDLSSCQWWIWADRADQRLGNTHLYDFLIYILPEKTISLCGAAGLGEINGRRSWIMQCELEDVYAHELGHNLGLYHASTPGNEYGDFSCPMGAAGIGLRHFNAPHKIQLGWATPQEARVDGAYELIPIELGGESLTVQDHHISARILPEYSISVHQHDGFLNTYLLSQNTTTVTINRGCNYSDVFHPNHQTWRAHWCAAQHFLCLIGVCVPRPIECDL